MTIPRDPDCLFLMLMQPECMPRRIILRFLPENARTLLMQAPCAQYISLKRFLALYGRGKRHHCELAICLVCLAHFLK